MFEKMNEKQIQQANQFVGMVGYLVGKRGKKGAIDYLSKNTSLSVKSAKSLVNSISKFYELNDNEVYYNE